MKIHLDNVDFSSRNGPHTFGQRLARKLIETGHDVLIDSGADADASVVFIEPSGKKLANRVVQRLDGIWFKPEEFERSNTRIRSLYDKADAVIWQSEFDKSMTTKWWGDKLGRVIHNGIDTPVVKVTNPQLLELRQRFQRVFVCSSNWHPQKRLRANIELFMKLASDNPDSCLLVLGANPNVYVPNPRIFYTGSISHEDCLEVYSIADWFIHLAWLDHCPNVVVEAISQNTPVICSSSGGTHELVGDFGLVIRDEDYIFELMDYDNPPAIDVSSVKLPEKALLGSSRDISMDSVVRSYIETIEGIL